MTWARNSLSAPQKVLRTSEDAGKKTGFVMALTDSASLTSPADSRDGRTNPLANPFAGFRAYFS
jgi:hypothetical protein